MYAPRNPFRNRIVQLLAERDTTELLFCEEHNFQQSHFNKIKNRRIVPGGVLMFRIAQAFGVPVEAVFELRK